MTTDSLLRKYTSLEPRPTLAERERSASLDDPDATDDLGCFGWLRGVKERSLMLELRKKTGTIRAISYGWIEVIEFDPSVGITLILPGKPIIIRGRHLNAEARTPNPHVCLFEGLTRHRVPWIKEASEPERMESTESHTLIERIEW